MSSQPTFQLEEAGIRIGGQLQPLRAACVHYFDLARRDWRPCLDQLIAMGFRCIDVPIPWRHHERRPGELALNSDDGGRDLVGFLELLHQLDLHAIIRPGPTLNAELTAYGLPERIVWDRPCQARTTRDNPVMVPGIVRMFPLPSYGSDAFRDEVRRYLSLLAGGLRSLAAPRGPVILAQLDHAAVLAQRCGPYEQDYHPDTIRRYRAHLRKQYGGLEQLNEAYGPAEGEQDRRFATIEPPHRFDARLPEEVLQHLDWVGFQEALVADAYASFADALREGGLHGCALSCQLPSVAEQAAVNVAELTEVVDLLGVPISGVASESTRVRLARETSAHAICARSCAAPPYAAELASGFAPLSAPLSTNDVFFSAMTALAYGIRGFNLHMAVERNRFIGAPVGVHGESGKEAEQWRRLIAALDRVGFHTLRREVPVRIVMPSMSRRLTRVMGVLGPVARMLPFGDDARERCLEDDLGLGHRLAIDADTFAQSFEQALDARGVPHARLPAEVGPAALEGASWVICPNSGPVKSAFRDRLAAAREAGARLTMGPLARGLDERLRPVADEVVAALGAEIVDKIDPASADAAVARAIEKLDLPSYACDPDTVHAAVHVDDTQTPRVVFIINGGANDVSARVAIGVDAQWEDAMDDSRTRSEAGVLEVHLRARSARMLIRS